MHSRRLPPHTPTAPHAPTAPHTPTARGIHEALAALRASAGVPSPLVGIEDERFTRRGVRLLLKRDDLIHPEIPGNKWRKLVPNLAAAVEGGYGTLLTFGGAYSHHLRATAAAGRLLGLRTVGVVRGEELAGRPLNATLTGCAGDGMRLHFVSRSDYRRRADPAWVGTLHERFGDFLAVPEGGSNAAAVHGCAELGRELRGRTDVAAVACGTGGTLAGLAAGLAGSGPGDAALTGTGAGGAYALGVPVLRGGFLPAEVRRLQDEAFGGPRGDWRTVDGFHCGGYARTSAGLEDFADDFAARHGLPGLERVYVAKLLLALCALAEECAFVPGSTVTAVITAGGDAGTGAQAPGHER